MADKTAQTIYIDADPSTVMDVIADIGSYPHWVNEYKECEVLEADAAGYPKTARLVLDAAVLGHHGVEVRLATGRPRLGEVDTGVVRYSRLSTAHITCRPRDPRTSPMNSRST